MSARDARLHAPQAAATRQPGLPSLMLGGERKPIQFATLAGLAARVEGLRQGRRLRHQLTYVTWPGFDTFPAFNVYRLDDYGGEDWIACVAIQTAEPARFEAALKQARAA